MQNLTELEKLEVYSLLLEKLNLDAEKLYLKHKILNWEQIRRIFNFGIEFGSHTINHPNLSHLSSEEAVIEIERSKEILSTRLKTNINTFCYPGGYFTNETKKFVKNAGYLCAVTSEEGFNIYAQYDRFKLKRLSVGNYSLPTFIAKLYGYYWWFYRGWSRKIGL